MTGSLGRSALSGFVWLSMGNGVRAVLKIGVLAMLARLVAPEAFGLVAAAGVIIWFSLIFANLGVGPALVQRRDLQPVHVGTAFVCSAALGCIVGALVLLLAPTIAALFRMPDLPAVLRAMAMIFPLAGLGVVSECLLQRALRFRMLAAVELAGYAIGYGVIGVTLAWFGFGVWALVAAELSKTAIKTILLLRAQKVALPISFDRGALRDLVGFGSGYTATALTTYLASQADSFIVARYLGASALGIYGRAYELMLVPAQALGVLLDKVLFPTLARVQHEQAHLRLAYRRCMALVALLVLPCVIATIILAPEIVRTLLGSAWEATILPLQILAIGMYFRVGYMVGQSVAHSVGAVRPIAWRNAVHAALVLAGALVGQRWGLPGIAAGVVIAITVNFLMVLQLATRLTGLSWIAVAAVHARAAALTLLLGGEVWLSATFLRGLQLANPLTLLITATLVAITTVLLVRFVPRLAGTDGVWMSELLYRHAPAPMRPWLGRPSAG